MSKKQIEQLTSSVAVIFLTILTIGGILFIADQFFNWNIFPPHIERAIGFIMVCFIIIIFSCVIVNIMLNISIIARSLTAIVEKKHDTKG